MATDDVPGYPGTCRHGPTRPGPTAQRFRVSDTRGDFTDLYQGVQTYDLTTSGDVVVERRDGIASYQLAVVVDDVYQGVTRVVRGADLIASTPWQIDLQAALGAPQPIYGHLPLLLEADGAKLSKSKRSVPLDPSQVAKGLTATLTFLSQTPASRIGAVYGPGRVEMGTCALEPASACGQRLHPPVRPQRHISRNCGINCGVQRGVLR